MSLYFVRCCRVLYALKLSPLDPEKTRHPGFSADRYGGGNRASRAKNKHPGGQGVCAIAQEIKRNLYLLWKLDENSLPS